MTKILLLIILMLFAACVPDSGGGGGKKSALSTNGTSLPNATPTPTPFAQASNFLQQGTTQTSSILALPAGFSDSFLARGNQINSYLNGTLNSSTVLCLVAGFNTNPDNKVGVFAAIPLYFNNFSSGTREYYLQFQPSEKSINQVNCQTSGVVASLLTTYPGKTAVFSLAEICPSCSNSIMSDGLRLVSTNGVSIPTVDLSGLRVQVGSQAGSNNSGGTCSGSSNCLSLGYDCCLNNQCVLDARPKDGVTIPTGVLTEVASNPASFKNYPEYYYICPINVPTPTPTPDTSNSEAVEAALRLEHLKELYDCTKGGTDELSICTYSLNGIKNDIINAGASGVPYTAPIDDLNFTTINPLMSVNNITEVKYAGELLYSESPAYIDTARLTLVGGTTNDNLTTGQTVIVKGAPSNSAPHDYLKIKFKIDGSCERLSASLARCKKYYVQGQSSSPTKVSDHISGQSFKLPSYLDSAYIVNVTVNGIVVPSGASTWSLASNNVVFVSGYPILTGQKLEITYYVSGSLATNVVTSKFSALTEINSLCANSGNNSCGNGNCGLTPLTVVNNGVSSIVDYSCVYPQPNVPEPPMQQTIYVSAKTVPHRYYDQSGVAQDEMNTANLVQEGTAFSYTNNNVLKPNNVSSYVGVNEVFGSFKPSDPNSAQPAKMVAVKKGRQYDIWVETGYYSPCPTCGNDYYSSLQKLFPQNFEYKGGGYKPSLTESSRTSNLSSYRADDLIFGRACFVPLTMIPWTHVASSVGVQTQRQNRLKAQHFLYANGYQRDWYGFDYGALLGSYDGVTWFAVGNQRRTTAAGNKLFLAVNGNFGDLTTLNNYAVTISEVTSFSGNSSPITSDYASDGAECQTFHMCSTDNDCVAKMGYEYSCQSVSNISTNWPQFNANGEEQLGVSNTRTIANIIGGLVGGSKRCVYRGRGAPCEQTYSTSAPTAEYAGSLAPLGVYSCNANYYCDAVTASRFNNKIARYGKSPANVNVDVPNTTDTFGLAAKILGRPNDFNGTLSVDSIVQTQLASNNLKAICIPGRNPATTVSTLEVINRTVPATRNGDKILGIGVTQTGSAASQTYVNQCTTFNSAGNFYNIVNPSDPNTNANTTLRGLAASQNIPTNTLDIKVGSITSIGTSTEIFTPSTGIVTKLGVQQNTCLRAPGASCQTELDCSPSKFISGKFNTVSQTDFLSMFNEAEYNFFKEGLVCAQDKDPVADKDTYDLKDNRCCRETNSKLTVYSANYNLTSSTQETNGHLLQTGTMPGIDYPIQDLTTPANAKWRYSRQAPAYDDMTSSGYPALKGLRFNLGNTIGDVAALLNQYKTFGEISSKTCCSKQWVRSFHTSNGGGHKWQQGKLQTIDKESLKLLSWNPNYLPGVNNFACTTGTTSTHYYLGANCSVRNFSPADETLYLEWFGQFELTGIPQIAIDRNKFFITTTPTHSTPGAGTPMPYKINTTSILSYYLTSSGDEYNGGGQQLFSANDSANFNPLMKQIFSDKEINCCISSDKETVSDSVTSDMCCTGTKHGTEKRCCLPDYTDVSVYMNRYVSSEGQGLSDSSYDSATGYIKDAGAVMLLAQAKGGGKGICCSGKMVYGRAIASLKVPGADDKDDKKTRRFAYNNTVTDNDPDQGEPSNSFDRGVRWNNHVYCVPSDYPDVSN